MEIKAIFIQHFLLPFIFLYSAAKQDFEYQELLIFRKKLKNIHLSRGLEPEFF